MRLLEGDCVELMRTLDEASVDAVVCDPPYGLEFMGKEWDKLQTAGRDDLRHRRRMDSAPDSEKGNPWASERKSYGTVKKNPRCKKCERLKFDHAPRRCSCSHPDWDLRIAESARVMQAWHLAWATEALRVLKPGGHLLAFGGTRTYHRLACAVEDAGFEIRDSLIWLYGSGFPKSLDVSKAIDKAAGAEREVVGKSARHVSGKPEQRTEGLNGSSTFAETVGMGAYVTAPATPEAIQWQGWGTALKPSHEPVVVARKPLSGTVAANVLAHGTGALNVDGCRVESAAPIQKAAGVLGFGDNRKNGYQLGTGAEYREGGRWPSNVILSPDSAAELDEQSGESTSSGGSGAASGLIDNDSIYGTFSGANKGGNAGGLGDKGGASRYFYTAKASRGERNAGLEGFEEKDSREGLKNSTARSYQINDAMGKPPIIRQNSHPTVKPIDLMRWLCRLVTPPGGTVLDPFTGSGTTGIAAHLEGFDFIGCEREAEYAAIAKARIEWWSQFPVGTAIDKALGVAAADRVAAESGQGSLLGLEEA